MNLNHFLKKLQKKETLYLKMPSADLPNLSDADLFYAVTIRTENKVDACHDLQEGLAALNDKERIFYAVNYLEVEVNNGGLCQFFVNASRAVAPLVSEYLGMIGAFEQQKLYDDFIGKYHIDVTDLSSFDIESFEDFTAQYERYPFDEFDDAFYKMTPLQDYLTKFVRENIRDF